MHATPVAKHNTVNHATPEATRSVVHDTPVAQQLVVYDPIQITSITIQYVNAI